MMSPVLLSASLLLRQSIKQPLTIIPIMLQFLRYGVCGGIATATDGLVFFLAAWLIFPALSGQDQLVQILGLTISPASEESRALNFMLANTLAFILSNFVAYVLNTLFVFQSKKERRNKEITAFYILSTLVAFLSIGLSMVMMKFLFLSTTLAYCIKVIFSVLVNFVARKKYVFV